MLILSYFITFTSSASTSRSTELHHPTPRNLQKQQLRIETLINVRLCQLLIHNMLQSHKLCNHELHQFHPTNMHHNIFEMQKYRYDSSPFKRKRTRLRFISSFQYPTHHQSDRSASKSCTCDPFNKFLFTTYVTIHCMFTVTIHVMLFSSILSCYHAISYDYQQKWTMRQYSASTQRLSGGLG